MVVLITGCSSGFGLGLVQKFLSNGHQVIATLRNVDQRRDLFCEEVKKYPGKLDLVEFNVTNATQRASLVKFIEYKYHGKLDLLINNAGIGYFGALADFSEEQVREQMEINFFAVTFLTQGVLPFLIAAKGRIINLSSVLGFLGMPFTSVYNASKFAIEGLTEALYFELRSKGVQVALIEPGGFRTKFAPNSNWAVQARNPVSPFYTETQAFEKMRNQIATRPNFASPKHVVNKIYNLAMKRKMPLRTRVGKDAASAYVLKRSIPESWALGVYNMVYRRMLNQKEKKQKVDHATTSSV